MTSVSIIGATGYTGAELLRYLSSHPGMNPVFLSSETYAGQKFSEVYPAFRGICDLPLLSLEEMLQTEAFGSLCFIALPHGHAMGIVPRILKKGVPVVDLGADYRFQDPAVYEDWYRLPHARNAAGVYGIPELHRESIKKSPLTANAGCYTTASILALAPMIASECIDTQSIIIDAKSGVSGAGRGAKTENLFCEANESLSAYGVASHRHTPEIEQELSLLNKCPIRLSFTPHLAPMNRGIFASCYASLLKSEKETEQAFQEFYRGEPFVRLLGKGGLPSTKYVRGSNYIDIGWHIDTRTQRLIILSALDNLGKGAAGQAVQNANLMLGLPETQGLLPLLSSL